MEIKDLKKSFDKKRVIDGLSLSLPERGALAFMGPSGCGKTTLLRIIAGLEKPDSGTIEGMPGRVSFVFQEPRLFPWLSAKDNVKLVCDDEKRAAEMLALVELEEDADKPIGELSGGMKQRVSIARALSYDADLYIFDEPFTGLDEDLKNRLCPKIKEATKNALLLIVTHDISEAKSLAEQIIVFEGEGLKNHTQTKNRE